MRVALDSLPPRARSILVLRYYADLDDRAIAQSLGISESTVRATASRALATLRATHRPTDHGDPSLTDNAPAHVVATSEEQR